MKLFFLKSPTGAFGLGYSAGQEAGIKDKDMADILIEQKFAITMAEKKRRDAAAKKEADTGKEADESTGTDRSGEAISQCLS